MKKEKEKEGTPSREKQKVEGGNNRNPAKTPTSQNAPPGKSINIFYEQRSSPMSDIRSKSNTFMGA